MSYSNEELAKLVEPTRLHRKIYTDPDIFELEMERIWGSAWIFIGHESQVPNPGDLFHHQYQSQDPGGDDPGPQGQGACPAQPLRPQGRQAGGHHLRQRPRVPLLLPRLDLQHRRHHPEDSQRGRLRQYRLRPERPDEQYAESAPAARATAASCSPPWTRMRPT